MSETPPIVEELVAEVRMEVREYGADAEYLTQILGQMFQRAYDAGREHEPVRSLLAAKDGDNR